MSIQNWGKSGILAYLWLKISHFGHIVWYMDFNFGLPLISIDIKGQTKLEVNWTRIDDFSFLKTTKISIFQNPILPECQSPKSLLLLLFSMNLSETFRSDVNMDFVDTNHGGFLI